MEKGLASPDPRVGFGQPKISDLIKKTREYESLGGNGISELIRDTLRSYREMHQGKEDVFQGQFLSDLSEFVNESGFQKKGGLKYLSKYQWKKYSIEDYGEFISFRHSVRDFSGQPVEDHIVKSAIKASLNTPSVCNRQGWFVHYYNDNSRINELLSFQNGNAGFSHCIDKLLLVTGNSKAFTRNEHNQLFWMEGFSP